MSAEEFHRWLVIDQLDPFGEERADLRLAVLDALVANIMGGHARPKDFMFEFGKTDEDRERELLEDFDLLLTSYGAEEGDPGQLLVAPEW